MTDNMARIGLFGSVFLLFLLTQGCVSYGLYYRPDADAPPDVKKQVRKAPCALPAGGPYAIFLKYPGLTLSASARGYMQTTYQPGPVDVDTSLAFRLKVGKQHSVVIDMSSIEVGGMSSHRYYCANVPAGRVNGSGQTGSHSGGIYTMVLSDTGVAPKKFQLKVPSLLLDGRQIGPITISFTQHFGVWTEPLSC